MLNNGSMTSVFKIENLNIIIRINCNISNIIPYLFFLREDCDQQHLPIPGISVYDNNLCSYIFYF